MENVSGVLVLFITVLFIILFIRLIRLPLKWAFKLLLHAIAGFVMLFLLNFFGSYINISLEMSWLNAIVSGVLGVPGVVLLLILKYIL